eukprot:GHVR01087893.1.p1 GENE.GHVR01087893.1~~GHVR01087893.1.p1  ORF type:complete len:184 (+),score=40.81 GHVR01087893.1:61-612(+)
MFMNAMLYLVKRCCPKDNTRKKKQFQKKTEPMSTESVVRISEDTFVVGDHHPISLQIDKSRPCSSRGEGSQAIQIVSYHHSRSGEPKYEPPRRSVLDNTIPIQPKSILRVPGEGALQRGNIDCNCTDCYTAYNTLTTAYNTLGTEYTGVLSGGEEGFNGWMGGLTDGGSPGVCVCVCVCDFCV